MHAHRSGRSRILSPKSCSSACNNPGTNEWLDRVEEYTAQKSQLPEPDVLEEDRLCMHTPV
jgi:hypothetical protein